MTTARLYGGVTRNLGGWRADPPDHRDHLLAIIPGNALLEPVPRVDLRSYPGFPGVYDQGSLGSCTANAVGFAYQFTELLQNNSQKFMPSRLFIYYNARALRGETAIDSGCDLRSVLTAAKTTGVCAESMWPYITSRFDKMPDPQCYVEASKCQVVEYVSVPQTLDHIKAPLVSHNPVIYGFKVFESFDSVSGNGKMPIPNTATEKVVGGHAVTIVGFDDDFVFDDHTPKGCFIVRNSWGSFWGDGGYFYVPYGVMLDSTICSSFWFIRSVTDPAEVVIPPLKCCDGCACSLM